MKQYLVLFMGTCDDIPVAILDDRDEAVALAKEIGAVEVKDGHGHHSRVDDALAVIGRDMGTFCGVSLLTFEGGGVAAYELVVDEDGNPCG